MDDSPTLRVPKEKARYAEAAQIQQQIAGLLQPMEASDRQMEAKAQWKPLLIQTAAANEVLALEPMLPEMESKLVKLQRDPKLAPDKKEEELKTLRKSISDTRVRLAHAKAAGGPAHTFTLHDGEALANADTPPESFYELTANANLPVLTAIRIEVPPLNPEMARHTPENGFIVDKVQAWVISPAGEKRRIAVRYFVQDSERNLQAALFPDPDPEDRTKKQKTRTRAHLPLFPSSFVPAGSSPFSPSRCTWLRAAASRST